MNKFFVGLDVHKDSIAVAIAEEARNGEVRSYGTIENTPASVNKLIKRLSTAECELNFCYEAGCCGYILYRQIIASGHACIVTAPSMIPVRPGDHVKTDRRDAIKLARLHRAGELDAIWVPDAVHEAMRDLIRLRSAAMIQHKAAKQQLQSFLLRHGRIYHGLKTWGRKHYQWLANQKFDLPTHQIVFQDCINAIHDTERRHYRLVKQIEEFVREWSLKPLVDALCTMKGINLISAATIVSVTGDLKRFSSPTKLSGYMGLVPCEHSSGDKVLRSRITRAGNSEARRVLIQSAWCYRYPPRVTPAKETCFADADKKVRDIAWRAQLRLCKRYRHYIARGKKATVACTAVARELTTFIWEMGQVVALTS